ncbi:Uncharacterised protein [Bordetella pertussis]|nr:Uncharacterised protein [Bordetella pertussis]
MRVGAMTTSTSGWPWKSWSGRAPARSRILRTSE